MPTFHGFVVEAPADIKCVVSKLTSILFYWLCHYIGSCRAKISTKTHIMHTSMVVKKDTASRVLVHGSNRAKINAETIVRCCTVVNMDNRKMIMSHSTVVKKDNASCDLVHGSSRDRINAEMNMRQSTVVQDKNAAILYSRNPEQQGFQHVYKSTTTSSSCRVQEAAYKLLFRSGTHQSELAARLEDQAKRMRIESRTVTCCMKTVWSSNFVNQIVVWVLSFCYLLNEDYLKVKFFPPNSRFRTAIVLLLVVWRLFGGQFVHQKLFKDSGAGACPKIRGLFGGQNLSTK